LQHVYYDRLICWYWRFGRW